MAEIMETAEMVEIVEMVESRFVITAPMEISVDSVVPVTSRFAVMEQHFETTGMRNQCPILC